MAFILSSSSLFLDHTLVDGSCRFLNKHSFFKTYTQHHSYYKQHHHHQFLVTALKHKTKDVPTSSSSSSEDVTKKYGLEAGLWKILFSPKQGTKEKSKSEEAKELLTKYGGAYLATSITLSLISFSLCYALISAGVDVPSLLNKLGIATNDTGEKVGTFALAYAAHKAASPIRFPPTVALTPIVASWIGNKDK